MTKLANDWECDGMVHPAPTWRLLLPGGSAERGLFDQGLFSNMSSRVFSGSSKYWNL